MTSVKKAKLVNITKLDKLEQESTLQSRKKYKHMSCVLGLADEHVAKTVEVIQDILGLSDSQFLRGVVHKFLIDAGYAKAMCSDDVQQAEKIGGLMLGDIAISMVKYKQLLKKQTVKAEKQSI